MKTRPGCRLQVRVHWVRMIFFFAKVKPWAGVPRKKGVAQDFSILEER